MMNLSKRCKEMKVAHHPFDPNCRNRFAKQGGIMPLTGWARAEGHTGAQTFFQRPAPQGEICAHWHRPRPRAPLASPGSQRQSHPTTPVLSSLLRMPGLASRPQRPINTVRSLMSSTPSLAGPRLGGRAAALARMARPPRRARLSRAAPLRAWSVRVSCAARRAPRRGCHQPCAT